jgi:antitoxin CptB
MRELDAVLHAFLDAHSAGMSDAEIACFEAILELPDPTLHAYCLGRSAPADPAAAALIRRICAAVDPQT